MKYHYPDFPRIPKDTDVIASEEGFSKCVFKDPDKPGRLDYQDDVKSCNVNPEHGMSAIVRYEGISTPFEYLFAAGQDSLELILAQLSNGSDYASPQVLYSLKKAHIHFPIKFDKHIKDFMFLREKLRQERGISLEQDLSSSTDLLEEFPALTGMHFAETEKRVGKLRTPNMAGENTEKFFGKSKKYVKSYYVHDNMHKAVATMHIGEPVYLQILAEGKEVETDENLWRKLSIQQKIFCVLEEVYVIALERKILPDIFESEDHGWTAKEAFDWALYRVCTTLCDGFFREFAVRAYDEIQKQYNPNYVEHFFKTISKYEENKDEE